MTKARRVTRPHRSSAGRRSIAIGAAVAVIAGLAALAGPAAVAVPTPGTCNPSGSGTGVSGDPFLVSTQAQLAAIDDAADCLTAFYKQSADIALVGAWTPLGETAPRSRFTGTYDGDWKTISGLRVGTSATPFSNGGLFGDVGGATISKLVLSDVQVFGVGGDGVGALAGYAYGSVAATLSEICVSGTVSGTYYVGMLVGDAATSAISKVVTQGSVTSRSDGVADTSGLVGGIVGWGKLLSESSSSATVTGFDKAGGLIGEALPGASISNSYATGAVSTTTSSTNYGGGLIGKYYDTGTTGTVDNSYAIGAVTAAVGGTSYKGGLIGGAGGPVTYNASFWDSQTSGQSTTATAAAATTTTGASITSVMKTAGTYSAWNSSIWTIAGGSYPTLAWTTAAGVPSACGGSPAPTPTPTPTPPAPVPAPAPEPSPTASATPTPTASPTASTTAVLGPVTNTANSGVPAGGVAPGTGVLIVNGEKVSVTVKPDARDEKLLEVSGPGFTMSLAGLNAQGKPLGLTPDGALILEQDRTAAVAGTGFQPNSLVYLYLFSEPRFLGTVQTDANGSFTGQVPLPADIADGRHTLQSNGFTPDGTVRSLSLGVVLATPVVATSKRATAKVYFESLSSVLTEEGMSTLKTLVKKTGKKGVRTVSIGYVQGTTITSNDEALSTQRAKNVAAYLKKLGLKGRFVVRGDGIAKESGPTARRVNISVTYLK